MHYGRQCGLYLAGLFRVQAGHQPDEEDQHVGDAGQVVAGGGQFQLTSLDQLLSLKNLAGNSGRAFLKNLLLFQIIRPNRNVSKVNNGL